MKDDSYLAQVAYVTGRLLHEGTGRAVVGDIEITADEGEVFGRVFEDGRFVVSAYEKFAALHLHIRARSEQYRAGEVTHAVVATIPPADDFDPETPTPPAPLVDLGDILLPGDEVNIRGRVTEAADPDAPILGAEVTITHAGPAGTEITPVLTDSDGRFRFDEVRVWSPASISAFANGFQTETRALLPDYGRLVNEEHFRLPPPP
ncbi:MAG TPA: carboxypeptidase-like regulatory domain-containing protein [Pyrinomonadaceae bacterium]|jgi:hypothetical protein